MNNDKQLTKVTNQWFIMLLFVVGIGSAFYWYSDIEVKNIGEIQFSQTLSFFNNNIQMYLNNIKCNTLYDFVFIISYSVLFYFTYRVFQSSMRISVSKLWIFICLIPGAFDIIENILLLNLLDHLDQRWLFNTFWFVVRAKWTFVIPFVLINFTILVYYVIRIINSLIK